MTKYVIITPARNEGAYIKQTIESVINQSVKPEKWVIVSDSSTDNTDEIVQGYSDLYDFICFVKTANQPHRNFSSKVAAFNFGYEQLEDVDYDFIGNLDGDMRLDHDYYSNVFKKFDQNPKLGIAGGVRMDLISGKLVKIRSARNSVAGGLQLFRRECFEKINGYQYLKYGGIDAVAEVSARMFGWEVESFADIITHHLKPTSAAVNNIFKQKFRAGVKFYLLGYHPIFPLLRFGTRIFTKPIIIGSLISIAGFFWAGFRKYERPVSESFVKYLRSEQNRRIKMWITGRTDKALRLR
jgi:glycosyltransferase involved in cell wall biosynthesis